MLRRTLVQALIFSALVHAALLLSVVALMPVRLDAPVTIITAVINREARTAIAQPVSVPFSPPAVVATRPKPAPVPAPIPVPALVRNVVDPKIAVSEPSSVPTPSAPVATPTQPVAPDTTSFGAPSSGTGSNAAPPSTGAPAREGVNADDLRQYRMALRSAAGRLSTDRYPALARERGWEGTVEIEVRVGRLLPGPAVTLARSSGRSVLDEFALELMKRAARITALPEGLKGKDFRDLVRWEFDLKDGQ